MRRDGRFNLALGLALGAALAFLVFLLARPVDDHDVRLALLAFPGRSERAVLQARSLLGHAAGDDLLVAVAGRLKTCVRGEGTVARLGGDEFAILLEQAPSHEVAVRVAGRILEAMRPPFTLGDRQVQVGASVGVTISDASEVDAVLREADVAMYTAKARGKGRYELASSSA